MNFNVDVSPSYHLGHVVFNHFAQYLDRVCQIEASTGEEESYASVLKRSIRLAKALRAFGLSPGDVVAIGGPNHLDICIPFYAALFNGLPSVGVDPYFKYDEVRTLLKITRPKIAFCQKSSYDIYAKAAVDLELDLKLVTFDEGNCTMSKFIDMYETPDPEDDFKVAEYDIDKIYVFLISTSGSSGKVKVASFMHRTFLPKCMLAFGWQYQDKELGGGSKTLVLSPINWISNYFTLISTAVCGTTKLQTSSDFLDNLDHIINIINKYRPEVTAFCPTFMASLLARKNDVDLFCFRNIAVGGSKVSRDLFKEFKKLLAENCVLWEPYAQTEMIGIGLYPNIFGPIGNCGKTLDIYKYKLVDSDTGDEIKEANITGELLVKGPVFLGYYNDPEETAKSFTEDGFFKTGDLLYRDEDNNYFFVERMKNVLKYRNSHVIPSELEELILKHPGVKEVCVVGIDALIDGHRPAACVVRKEGCNVTAQEIKDLVASNLSANKKLRGGVIFLESLLYTSTGKIAKDKMKELATRITSE